MMQAFTLFGTEACACPLTSRRRFAKRKSKARALLRSVFNFLVPNQCGALYGIRNSLRYGIDTKCRMESVADGMESRPKGDGEIQAFA